MAEISHQELCKFLGIPESDPAPYWLPYAVQATRIRIEYHTRIEGGASHWGGGFRCGGCGFGLDVLPGPGTQHPEPEAMLRCPKCGFDGKNKPTTFTVKEDANTQEGNGQAD